MLLPPRPPLHHEDKDPSPGGARPWWRRPKVIALVSTAGVLAFWAMTHGQPTSKQIEPSGSARQTSIAQTEPYVGPQDPEPPPPAPPPQAPSPPASRQPPPPPAARGVEPPPPPAPRMQQFAPQMPAGLPARDTGGRYAVMSSFDVRKAPKVEIPAAPDQTGFKFETAKIDVDKASPAMDETYLLQPGLLPIELDVAIDSNLPGPLFGHVRGNIYSNAGVLLIEDGSQVQGRYESMKNGGVNRLFAVNAIIHTPHGVWIKIPEEPLGDDLGRVGLDGTVDQHYVARFGAAIGLNITDAMLQVLQAEVSKNGSGNSYLQLNTGSGVGSLANQILQQTINIPPTFSRPQGSLAEILISRPIDFSDSYRIQRTTNAAR